MVQAGLAEVRRSASVHEHQCVQHIKLIEKFVSPIAAIRNKLFLGYQGTVGTFSAHTAGRMEGEHGMFRTSKVAPKRSSQSLLTLLTVVGSA